MFSLEVQPEIYIKIYFQIERNAMQMHLGFSWQPNDLSM